MLEPSAPGRDSKEAGLVIWNPFKSNSPQSSLQSPPELSSLLNTVAALFINKQFPFGEWEDKRTSITEDERLFFARVCLTAQLSSFAHAIETITNDPLVAELCMHSLLKKIAPDFDECITSSVFFRYYTIQKTLVNDLVNMKLGGQSQGEGDPKEQIAIQWVAMENKYNDRSFGVDTAFKLSVHLRFAISKSADIFNKMCRRIKIWDIENILPIHFLDEMALFEETLYKKYRYPEIFEMPNRVNARDVIAARRLEDQRFWSNRDTLVHLNNTAQELLKKDFTTEDTYNSVREWLFGLGACGVDCYAVGGRLKEVLSALDHLRQSTFESLKSIAATQGVASRYEQLYNVCDNSYSGFTESKILLRIRVSETKEVVPFMLTFSEEDIIEYRDNVDSDGEMSRSLAGFALDLIEKLKTYPEHATAEKVRFLGKRVDVLMNRARK